jgi:hypothetical protein
MPLFDTRLRRKHVSRWAHSSSFTSFPYIIPDFCERFSFYPRRKWDSLLDLGSFTHEAGQALIAQEDIGLVFRIVPTLPPNLPTFPKIRLCVSDEERLPLSPKQFCGAFSLFSLQSLSNIPDILSQTRATLKDNGVFLGCLFGGATLTELRQSFALAENDLYSGMTPRIAPFMTWQDLGDLLTHVGFKQPVIDRECLSKFYPSSRVLMEDIRNKGMANILTERSRTFTSQRLLDRVDFLYRQHFPKQSSEGKEGIHATFEILWFSACT